MEASRAFVCVRPQTYEDEAEAKILSYVFAGRSGLENTSFALLDPEGKKITRGSRSPSMTYGTNERFAAALVETAQRFEKRAEPIEALPTHRDLRIALNVSAADMRPLIIVRGKNEADTAALARRVATFAWSEAAVGTSHYVVLNEEETYEGLSPALGVSVVQPDPYGLGGELLGSVGPSVGDTELAESLTSLLAKHKAETREHDRHVREARRKGIKWESTIPVSDPHERRQRRRE